MNEFPPFVLKGDDQPEPQQAGIALLDALRTLAEDALRLRDLLARETIVSRKPLNLSVDLAEDAARAYDQAESLMRSVRAAGLVSLPYSEVRHGG